MERKYTSATHPTKVFLDETQELNYNYSSSSLNLQLERPNHYKILMRCNFVSIEPTNFDEASKYEELNVAMQEEMHMIKKNKTWELVQRPQNKKVIEVKWVCRTKLYPEFLKTQFISIRQDWWLRAMLNSLGLISVILLL